MSSVKSSPARRNASVPSARGSFRSVSLRRFIAILAFPIVGLNYVLIAGASANLLLIGAFLVGAAIIGFMLASGENYEAHNEQADSTTLLESLFDSSPDALLLLEPLTGQILDASPRALKLFEVTNKDELVGAEFASLQRVRLTDEKALDVLTNSNMQGRWPKECAYATRRGKEIWGDLSLREFRHGQRSLLLARVADMTDHKRREEKVGQDKVTFETANAAKAEFLADLSQRIMLSVNGALQTTSLVRDIQLTPEQQHYAEFGRNAAEALLTTVNDILDFGNIESGQLALDPIAFDLRTTVEDTIGRLAQQAETNNIDLTCLMSHDIPTPLWGDPGRLRQVFSNIIENALANTTPGSVTIRGAMTHRAPTCVTFRFSVTAPGFVLSQLIPLFQLSAQSNSSLRTHRGRWFGLAVSKNLVKLLGGEMGVEQSPTQEGTVWFTVTLEKQPPKALAAPPPRAHLHDVKALLIGDSQTVLHEQLVHWGMISHSVADTELARHMLNAATEAEAPYDLVVLNYATVDRDVLSFAASLRESPTLSALRIVVLTAAGKKGDAQQARQAGIDAYLPKPVPQSLLFDCLATLMNQPPKTVAPNTPLVTRYTLSEARARKRPRVLVVDSDPSGQKLAARVLTQIGYRVDIATDGHEGVEAHANISYATVLLANNLSGMSGLVTAAEIRQRDREEQTYTPIIGLIGDDGTTYEQCLAAGIDDALVKPLIVDDLKAALEAHSNRTAPIGDTELPASALADEIGFDLNAALARVDGDQQFLNEIISLFLQEYPKHLANMRAALAHHDSHSLTFAANLLRGSLSNFAAAPAANAALRLENLARQGDLSPAPTALDHLEEAIAQLVPMLSGVVMENAA